MGPPKQFRVTKSESESQPKSVATSSKLSTETKQIEEFWNSFSGELLALSSDRYSIERKVEGGLSGGIKLNTMMRYVEVLQAELAGVTKAQSSLSRSNLTLKTSINKVKDREKYMESCRADIRRKISGVIEQLEGSKGAGKAVAAQIRLATDGIDKESSATTDE